MRAYWRAYVSYRIGSAYTLSRVRSSYEDRKLSNRSNFFFFPRNQIFLLLSIHSISSIIVVSNNTPTHRSIRYREIDRCRNSGNTVISVIGRAYRTRLFIYIYTYLDAISAATAFSRSIGALCFFRARASNDQLTALCSNILSVHVFHRAARVEQAGQRFRFRSARTGTRSTSKSISFDRNSLFPPNSRAKQNTNE